MTAIQVRRHASSYGFRLVVENDQLRARGNAAAMTPELKGLIDAHKADVIASIKADEKAEQADAVETVRWFIGFKQANVGGKRIYKGEEIDLVEACKGLSDAMDRIGQLPRVLPHEEDDFQRQQSHWINEIRWFREVFEDGEIA